MMDIYSISSKDDSIQKRYRQITTAVADGTIAALGAAGFVNNIKKQKKSEQLKEKFITV